MFAKKSAKESQVQVTKTEFLLFNAKDIGASLKEVAVDVIKREGENIESRWYHSPKDADLFFWRNDRGSIIKQQVTYYGQLTEWSLIEGLRTGLLIEDETSQKISSSPLIRYDSRPQLQAVAQSIEIVENITSLSLDDRAKIIQNFAASPIGIPNQQAATDESSVWQHLVNKVGHLFKKK